MTTGEDKPPSRTPASTRECFDIMAREQREEYLDHMERRVNAHVAHHEEMERIGAYLNAERRAILDGPRPRDICPGCFATIYDGAAKQGWCCDCMPKRAKYEKEAYGY